MNPQRLDTGKTWKKVVARCQSDAIAIREPCRELHLGRCKPSSLSHDGPARSLVRDDLSHSGPHPIRFYNLCLAGNHNMLELVRPYTWREVDTTLGDGRYDNEETNRALATRLHSFFTEFHQGCRSSLSKHHSFWLAFWFFPFPLSCRARTP
jgi:hypothetical protein